MNGKYMELLASGSYKQIAGARINPNGSFKH
jgi:hypothetical protein